MDIKLLLLLPFIITAFSSCYTNMNVNNDNTYQIIGPTKNIIHNIKSKKLNPLKPTIIVSSLTSTEPFDSKKMFYENNNKFISKLMIGDFHGIANLYYKR